jgi:hypothetical protein
MKTTIARSCTPYAIRPSAFTGSHFNVFNSSVRLAQWIHVPPVTDQRLSKRSTDDWVCHAMRELEITRWTGLTFGCYEGDLRLTPTHLSRSIYCCVERDVDPFYTPCHSSCLFSKMMKGNVFNQLHLETISLRIIQLRESFDKEEEIEILFGVFYMKSM